MDSFEFDNMIAIHNDQWPDSLLSITFNNIHWILTPKERAVLSTKVQLYEEGFLEEDANKQIAKLLKVSQARVVRMLYNIKSKFRHGMDVRVDNKLHPEIYRAKVRKVKKQNATKNT